MKLSTTFHPHKDVQEESRTQTLEDMLRAYVMEFKGNWDDHFPLIEFSHKKNYHSSIGIAPLKDIYTYIAGYVGI